MLSTATSMRARLVLAAVFVVASVAAASCGEGGNGTGTAPDLPPGCPKTTAELTNPCAALNVCDFPAEQKVAICPFANGTWEIHERGEAGTFADAIIPEVAVDTGTPEVSEVGDVGDAPAETTTDALDDASEVASDDAADAASDVPIDTAVVTDAASDGG